MSVETPRTELVYGDGGEGTVFLERDYALDIASFREALYKARTWGGLKSMVSEERYEETMDRWIESERDRLIDEDELEDEEPEVVPPGPDVTFDVSSITGYEDGYWPEFAPNVMDTWVDDEIIEEHGRYVETVLDVGYTVIDPENEETVASLLEEQGYVCVRDDDLVWNAIWGG